MQKKNISSFYNLFETNFMSSIYTPRKRRREANDPFFEEGNIALRAIWLNKQARSQMELDMIQEEVTELLE